MSDNQSTVEYRPIPGFPGYRAGNDGSVWSQWKCIALGRPHGFHWAIGDEWHRLKTLTVRKGYLQITLRRNGKSFQRTVHRVVLESFVGPKPKKHECRHFPDRNPANNALVNLSWATREQNEADKKFHRAQKV
jgi:hypothetical protein